MLDRDAKNLYQVEQSTVKYCFSFQTLSDRNMKMSCHAICFLQRLNLVPRSYIIFGDSPENLRKLSVYEKSYHPGN